MKILDLLLEEIIQTDRSTKQYNGRLARQGWIGSNKNTDTRRLGKGTQASVKDDPTDPHMVKKHNINPYGEEENKHDDGFNTYISYLIDNKLMGENPHFPRVYNIKTIKDKNGRHIHSFTIEKLLPYDSASQEEVLAFIENNLAPDTIYIPEYLRNDWVHHIMERIASFLEQAAFNGTHITKITSEPLLEALKVLERIESAGANRDLHAGNLMWRRTSTGMILVLNDPFY